MVNKTTMKGVLREAAGNAKAAVGRAVGSPGMQVEGNSEAAAGKTQKIVGQAITKVKSLTK